MSARDEMAISDNRWYRLDNAAKIYPAISGAGKGSIFRMAVQLKEEVDPQILKEALDKILPRFPTFAVKMHRGLFWYYFEPNPEDVAVSLEKAPACRPIVINETNGYLFRVTYYKKRIALEVFHALTDGAGALSFLKSITFQYLLLSGHRVVSDGTVLDRNTLPSVEEWEDSFTKFYRSCTKCKWIEDKAYNIYGTRVSWESVKIVHGILALDAMLALAKASKATLTEYITALIIFSIYKNQLVKRESPHPVKVSVPVNLRKFFPSKTLRNFSSYVNVGVHFENRDYTFEEVLDSVRAIMKAEVQPDRLIEKLSSNVKAEKNIFMRIVPLILKNVVLRTAFNAYGETLFTTTLSNLGPITLPPSMEEHVDRFEFVLGPPVANMINSTVCSYQNQLMITFTKAMHETDIEKFFFRFLVEKGLEVTIETN